MKRRFTGANGYTGEWPIALNCLRYRLKTNKIESKPPMTPFLSVYPTLSVSFHQGDCRIIAQQGGFRAWLSILAILLIASPARSQPAQPVTAQQAQQTINGAVKFLLDTQLDDGGWPEYSRQYPYGVSSLVTLALLNAGLDPEQPDMAEALGYLSQRELDKTYTVSLQTMALCTANPNKYARQIERNTEWLMEKQLKNGGWDYGDGAAGAGDPSNSQFALLALHEAQRAGVKLSDESKWKVAFGRAKGYWEGLQNRDGSFNYVSGRPPSGSMTCAGIASLVIVGSQLDELESSGDNGIECCGPGQKDQARIEQALKWMGDNFSIHTNPGDRASYHFYYIYALERVGRLTGRRFIGNCDWYREGVEKLVGLQDKTQGKIVSTSQFQGNEYSETAFALLFLSKGKRQTVVSRLQYAGAPNDWNHHSIAIQHLTAHTERAWKRDLSWQNVDLSRSTVKDLLETPVLFISGTSVPNFNQAQKRVLKEYVEQGGFIFAEACQGNGCDGKAFEEYFQRLVVELWDAPLEKLSPDHPIWYAESRVVPEDLPAGTWLYGVQTCCRLGVVYAPFSMSCRWELNLPYGLKPDFPEEVQSELDTVTKVGINVLSYATGKELKEKLDTVTILEEVRNQIPTDRGVFFLPKLRHSAGADDAPRAIPNLIQWLDKSNTFQLDSGKRLVNISQKELARHPVVFIHGRGELKFSQIERDILKAYLENGGFIFGDAICADEAFAKSFQQEIKLITDETLTRMEASHPIFTNQYNGFDIGVVTVIDPDHSGDSINAAKQKRAPWLESVKVDNRLAVVFSPLDLSCALESRHSLQCRGYIRDDAARIGINVILYALQSTD